ncbi:hypothetical protein B0H19DRAFT_1377881 [Mycena capillaripes]|nr:hypothetical protein B0H19DRAFT_1377881 [Mycena capillaripes]
MVVAPCPPRVRLEVIDLRFLSNGTSPSLHAEEPDFDHRVYNFGFGQAESAELARILLALLRPDRHTQFNRFALSLPARPQSIVVEILISCAAAIPLGPAAPFISTSADLSLRHTKSTSFFWMAPQYTFPHRGSSIPVLSSSCGVGQIHPPRPAPTHLHGHHPSPTQLRSVPPNLLAAGCLTTIVFPASWTLRAAHTLWTWDRLRWDICIFVTGGSLLVVGLTSITKSAALAPSASGFGVNAGVADDAGVHLPGTRPYGQRVLSPLSPTPNPIWRRASAGRYAHHWYTSQTPPDSIAPDSPWLLRQTFVHGSSFVTAKTIF